MSVVADRYAQALFEVCEKKGSTKKVVECLEALAESLDDHADVKSFLNSPMVASEDKVSLLKSALQKNMPEELDTFFQLLAKNNRLGQIPSVVKAFKGIVDESTGVMTGVVTSAVTLSDQEKSDVQKTIEGKLGHKVLLNFNVEKDMIGGLEARVGSYIFEDSVRSHMQKLNDFITRRVQ